MNGVKKGWIVGICLVLLLVGVGYIYYPIWGRTVTYSNSSNITQYPGYGEIKDYFPGEVMADPKVNGRPIFDKIENMSLYSTDEYNVFVTPAGYELSYAVGKFEGWEDIENSQDKYILLKMVTSIERYRVGFEPSTLFNSYEPATSRIFVENVGIRFNFEDKNSIEDLSKRAISDYGYNIVSQMIKKDDVLVVTPIVDPPSRAKKDGNGVYLIDQLILRRAMGAKEIEK